MMFRRFNKWLCKKLGHKQGWFPSAPWRCERCGADFTKEWNEKHSETYYKREAELSTWDKEVGEK